MIKSYQDLALNIPEDTHYEPLLCQVKLCALTVGEEQVYGEVTAWMGYDESGNYFVPIDVIDSRLVTDSEDELLNYDCETMFYAMLAAYERFENYFEFDQVREI